MADQQVVTIRGSNLGSSILEGTAIEEFKASLKGPLLRPGEAGYDDARKIWNGWNGMIDRRPALIACCRGVADVINSVNFAGTHGLLIAVRGGGHNVAGNAVCDGRPDDRPVRDEKRPRRSCAADGARRGWCHMG
jgi:hypothetical protein